MINTRLDRSSGDAFIYVIEDGKTVFEYFTGLNNREWNLLSENEKEVLVEKAIEEYKDYK